MQLVCPSYTGEWVCLMRNVLISGEVSYLQIRSSDSEKRICVYLYVYVCVSICVIICTYKHNIHTYRESKCGKMLIFEESR